MAMQLFRSEALRRLLCTAEASLILQRTVGQQLSAVPAACTSLLGVGQRHMHTSLPPRQAEAAVAMEASHEAADLGSDSLTPKQVVELLNRHIVGQADAKRAVANALRNRWRRRRVPSPMKEDIVPKNILMIGPTGCGKTEIARRLAKLADAPFVKVEATKFTEVGFHGRDVDQIIRDLLDNAIVMMRSRMRAQMKAQISSAVEERIVAALCGEGASESTKATMRNLYRLGELDERTVKIEVPSRQQQGVVLPEGAMGMQEVMMRVDKLFNKRSSEKREVKVSEARGLIEEGEAERLITNDAVAREAIAAVEQDGIVFIDEIDKIVTSSDMRYGADASSEGVQRDLLPIIEGSTVSTKHGNVATDHILFIASGAFHSCKPSDMLAELQGRLPIRVELKGLTRDDFYRILTEPEHNMLRQQAALLATEGLALHFTDAAVREVARVAEEVNRSLDNIGARRLHTILERIVDDISFEAPELAASAQARGQESHAVVIDREQVAAKMADLTKRQDLSKYVL